MSNDDLSLCRLSVYLRGDNLHPEQISKLVGFDPTEGRYKGEIWTTSSNKTVVEKTGIWSWTRSVETADVEGELLAFLLMFPDGIRFKEMPGVTDAFLDIFVANNTDESGGGQGELTLDPKCLFQLAALALPFEITIAVVNE